MGNAILHLHLGLHPLEVKLDAKEHASGNSQQKVRIPEHMFDDLDRLAELLDESYDYVMSLDPK